MAARRLQPRHDAVCEAQRREQDCRDADEGDIERGRPAGALGIEGHPEREGQPEEAQEEVHEGDAGEQGDRRPRKLDHSSGTSKST